MASLWGNSYPPSHWGSRPLSPNWWNLEGILQGSLQLPEELLQSAVTGPGSLQECLFPARRRVSCAHRPAHQDLELLRGVCALCAGCPASLGQP